MKPSSRKKPVLAKPPLVAEPDEGIYTMHYLDERYVVQLCDRSVGQVPFTRDLRYVNFLSGAMRMPCLIRELMDAGATFERLPFELQKSGPLLEVGNQRKAKSG